MSDLFWLRPLRLGDINRAFTDIFVMTDDEGEDLLRELEGLPPRAARVEFEPQAPANIQAGQNVDKKPAMSAQVPQAPGPNIIEDLGEENDKAARTIYLVTLPHPKTSCAQDGTVLKAPSSYTRKQIIQAFLAAMQSTQAGRNTPLRLLLMCVFREKHAKGWTISHPNLSEPLIIFPMPPSMSDPWPH